MKLSLVKILRSQGGYVARVIVHSSNTNWSRNYSCLEDRQQCLLDSCSINPTHQEPRVVIVGAGIAGLSAASRLSQCGIRNFVVLEAKER